VGRQSRKDWKILEKSSLIEFSLSLSKNVDHGLFKRKMSIRKNVKSHTCRAPYRKGKKKNQTNLKKEKKKKDLFGAGCSKFLFTLEAHG
jgi:hypothetical protein